MKRGALIVLEGCDRCGKSTQCRKLLTELEKLNIGAKCFSFPDRTTPIGCVINDYLAKKIELTDKAIHLLFSANRWELEPKIKSLLSDGVTLLVDRYFYSGIAFSAAKPGMNLEWCSQSDYGLPKPDLVLFLNVTTEVAVSRANYGNERYENVDFQEKVAKNYKLLQDSTWKIVESVNSIEDTTEVLLKHVLKAVNDAVHSPLQYFGN